MPYPKQLLEFYTKAPGEGLTRAQWLRLLETEHCSYLGRRCLKMRKSTADVTIGSCTVGYKGDAVIICPYRFLQQRRIFLNTVHLLEKHDRGNDLHVVSEIQIPGGTVDFFVVSVKDGVIIDYLTLELQSLDTTGTVWPAREQFIRSHIDPSRAVSPKSYGMNWKMTAKTTLVQMHHKAESLELLGKKMVLVVQDCMYDYIAREFNTSSVRVADPSDSVQVHTYHLGQQPTGEFALRLASQYSTTAAGVAVMLGSSRSAEISDAELKTKIRTKISDRTLLRPEFHPLDTPPQVEPFESPAE